METVWCIAALKKKEILVEHLSNDRRFFSIFSAGRLVLGDSSSLMVAIDGNGMLGTEATMRKKEYSTAN